MKVVNNIHTVLEIFVFSVVTSHLLTVGLSGVISINRLDVSVSIGGCQLT